MKRKKEKYREEESVRGRESQREVKTVGERKRESDTAK